MTRHTKKNSAKTAPVAAVVTPNETPLNTYHIAYDGRSFRLEAVEVEVNGNHYTFIGEDGEPNGFFPTALTGITRL